MTQPVILSQIMYTSPAWGTVVVWLSKSKTWENLECVGEVAGVWTGVFSAVVEIEAIFSGDDEAMRI